MSNAWSLGSNNHRLFVAKLVPCLIGYFSATNRGASYPANMVDLFCKAWEVLVPEMVHSQYTSQGNCCLRFAWLGWLDKWVLGLGLLSTFFPHLNICSKRRSEQGPLDFDVVWDVSSAFPIWTIKFDHHVGRISVVHLRLGVAISTFLMFSLASGKVRRLWKTLPAEVFRKATRGRFSRLLVAGGRLIPWAEWKMSPRQCQCFGLFCMWTGLKAPTFVWSSHSFKSYYCRWRIQKETP